mmetsp:Transcript_46362/g.91431  ORF Transcript_46362/g.91431 Transcript_46362/m.91431 type:complete len:117 (+) Transcript_46362:137-487(+)
MSPHRACPPPVDFLPRSKESSVSSLLCALGTKNRKEGRKEERKKERKKERPKVSKKDRKKDGIQLHLNLSSPPLFHTHHMVMPRNSTHAPIQLSLSHVNSWTYMRLDTGTCVQTDT